MSASQSYRPEWMSPRAQEVDLASEAGRRGPAVNPYMAAWQNFANAYQPAPKPAGHRVTLTRPRFLRSPLVITTNANPSHADALRDLRHQYRHVTGGAEYLPRRGDTLIHTF